MTVGTSCPRLNTKFIKFLTCSYSVIDYTVLTIVLQRLFKKQKKALLAIIPGHKSGLSKENQVYGHPNYPRLISIDYFRITKCSYLIFEGFKAYVFIIINAVLVKVDLSFYILSTPVITSGE